MIYEKIVVKVSLPIAHCVMFSFVCFQVNKSEICSNNKGDKISVGEDHDVDFCQNNLGTQHENGDLRKIKVCVNLRKVGHPTLR